MKPSEKGGYVICSLRGKFCITLNWSRIMWGRRLWAEGFSLEKQPSNYYYLCTRETTSTRAWAFTISSSCSSFEGFFYSVFIRSSLVLSGCLIRRNKSFILYDWLIERFCCLTNRRLLYDPEVSRFWHIWFWWFFVYQLHRSYMLELSYRTWAL